MQLGIKAGDLTRALIPSIGNLNINVILRVGHLADITPCDIIMHINRACKILKKVVVLGAGNTHNLVAQGHFSLAHIKLDKYKRMKLNEPQQNRCLFNCFKQVATATVLQVTLTSHAWSTTVIDIVD
jgi:hypothetical protein